MSRVLVFYEKLSPRAYKADTAAEGQKVMQHVLNQRIGQEGRFRKPEQLKEAIDASGDPVNAANFLRKYRDEMHSNYEWLEVTEVP